MKNYGAKIGRSYIVKNGVYIHKNFNILATRDEYVGGNPVKDNPDYMVVPVGSLVDVTRSKTSGNWPMTSFTQIIGNIKIGGKTYKNVIISSVFSDSANGKNTDKYVAAIGVENHDM